MGEETNPQRSDMPPKRKDWEVTGLGLEVDQLAQNLMTSLPTISFCPLYPTFSE